MAVSQYALKWDKYEENMKTFFEEIKGQSEFADVTLVTGDGQHLDVHRLILSSFSPVLRTMFGQKSSSNTLLFLRGVSSKCLGAILNFMYLGEVNILEDDLEEFLAVAKDLEMKGLTNEGTLTSTQVPQKPQQAQKVMESQNIKSADENFQDLDLKNDDLEELDHQLKMLNEMNLPAKEEKPNEVDEPKEFVTLDEVAIAHNDKALVDGSVDFQYDGTISRRELEDLLSKSMVKIVGGFSCTNCDKKTFGSKNGRSHMKRHIEAKHIPGLEFNCPQCGQKFSSRNSVTRHIMRLHKMQ